MRVADPGELNHQSVLFEFGFLDTPGFNDTKERDYSHATNILDEMIKKQHLNLILILVPHMTALTQEYREALEYYSSVLRGLHSRIILLHTKVDYAEFHHTNIRFHQTMDDKNTEIRKILQRPMLNPDHATCLIRKTIRDILTEAMVPPVTLDTSTQNIERMYNVMHPYKVAKERRQKARSRLSAMPQRPPPPPPPPPVQSVGMDSPHETSILVLGKAQSGKSLFIEFVKNYADPQYRIDESRIGTGIRSTTGEPVLSVVKSNLPVYEVFDSDETRIDISTLGDKYVDPEDYLDALYDRKATLGPVPQNPDTSLPFVEIAFLDTPGIEDTNGRDIEHAQNIIDAMATMRSLNLIIIIVNCNETPSKRHQLAFNYYSKVIHTFQGHHSNIVFLYTHAKY
ncbi:hypothetical protein BG005_008384 [Podila minutissima]|nr:hypothetical protein BG005_008384 [Podila minutissima]